MQMRFFDRRDWLKATAVAFVLPTLVPRSVLAAPGRPGANDRIQAGLIGSGFRSRDLTKESPLDPRIAALADCDLRRIAMLLLFVVTGLLPGRLTIGAETAARPTPAVRSAFEVPLGQKAGQCRAAPVELGRVAPGDCSPGAPTDPDVQDYRIRFLK